MKRKALILTLVALGMALAATSTGIDLNPKNWFSDSSPKTNKVPLAPIVPLPAGTTPQL